MKKILVLIFSVVLLLSTATVVFADNYDAELVVSGDYDSNTKIFTVHASINNIKPEYGIIIVEYDINFDDSDLELISATPNMPDAWKPYVDSQNAEDLSHKVSNKKYTWAVVMSKVKLGIKDDEQLKIDLKFKVKKFKEIEVRFDSIVVATEVPFKYNGKTMYEPKPIHVNDATLEFNSGNNNSQGDVSIDASTDVSREPDKVEPPVVSQPNDESKEPEQPVVSEPSDVSKEPEQPVVSEPNGESKEPQVSESPDVSNEPSVSVPSDESVVIDVSDVSVSSDDPSLDSNASDESDSINDTESRAPVHGGITLPDVDFSSQGIEINEEADHQDYINDLLLKIGIAVVIVALGVVAFVVYKRKSKKDVSND